MEQIVKLVAGDSFGQIFITDTNRDVYKRQPKYNAMAHNPDKTIAAEGRKALDIIHGFNITFKADGTFTGRDVYKRQL